MIYDGRGDNSSRLLKRQVQSTEILSDIVVKQRGVDNPTGRNYNNADSRIRKGGADMANEMGKRYRCAKCGTELIVTRAGNGAVACCGQPMEKKT